MQNTQPPAKKLRTQGGLGKATSAGDNTDPTLKKKQSNKKKKEGEVRIAESRQFLVKNYRGALQEYLQKQGDFKLSFDTEQKNESNSKLPKMYVSTCNANDIVGTGEAPSKKQAVHLAALAVIKEMKLISAREYRSLSKAAREAKQAKKSKTAPAPKVAVPKKSKEELLKEREVDEEGKLYRGTVKFFLTAQSYGFITPDEKEINFKGLTAKGRIYVAKDDIVCYSQEIGLNAKSKVVFKLYKDSMGMGAYEVTGEDGSPIIYEPKTVTTGDAGNEVKPKRKKKSKVGPMVENKQYLLGNFRGALQEYLTKKHSEVKLEFETEVQEPNTKPPVFIATCKAVGAEVDRLKKLVGTGHAASKKQAVHFSALEYMLKLNLLSAKQHFKIHHQNKDGSAVDASK